MQDSVTEQIPNDEDIESGQRDDPDKPKEGDSNRTMMYLIMLCCCVVVLAIIGIILGVVVFKDDDPEIGPAAAALNGATPTPAPVVPLPAIPAPSSLPTRSPQPSVTPFAAVTVAPTVTAAPSGPIPEEIIIRPGADTYITSGAVNHGAEDILLVQNGVGGNDVAVSLVSFDIENITSLPDSVLDGRVESATVIFTVKPDANAISSNVTTMIQIARLPSTPLSIEDLGNDSFEQPANKTIGSIFEVPSDATTVSADVTDFLFRKTDVVIRRRLTTQEKQLFLELTNQGTGQAQSSQFYSRESDFPPQLVIGLKRISESPTVSLAPSVSSGPSLRPSASPAPSLSTKPSLRPSTAPSAKPSLSQNPSDSPTTSTAPSVQVSVPSNSNMTTPNVNMTTPNVNMTTPNVNMTTPTTDVNTTTPTTDVNMTTPTTDVNTTLPTTDVNMTTPTIPGNGTDTFICNICGEGMKIGDLTGVVVRPNQDERTCADYQEGGDLGMIPETECTLILSSVDPCKCEIAL
jgi:hypothetical protein